MSAPTVRSVSSRHIAQWRGARFASTAQCANSARASGIPAAARRLAWAAVAAAAVFLSPPAPTQSPPPGAAAPAATAPQPAIARSPKIGLVLSGGAARGLTHVGVLQVLEELRVPVDYISATSMGSFVGGLYATGTTAAELERLFTSLDWPSFHSDQPPRRELPVRRKQEEAILTVPGEIGFRDFSLRLATGALSGQKLELLLHELTLRHDDVASFDSLPIPFRAVATDMVDGREVVFDRGPLYVAMRGSMSLPGVFAPIEFEGKILGDGGLVKNLPVDIARAMGAEVVIAVNIGTPLMTREQLSSFVGVAEQSINILTAQNVRAQLALLTPRDVLITPDLGKLSIVDFDQSAQFIELGRKAARAAAQSLSRYALSTEAYAAYRESLYRPPAAAEPALAFAGIRGTETTNPAVLQAQAGLAPGTLVDLKTAQDRIATLFGRGDFERIDYRLTDDQGRRGIEFTVSEKRWGPNFLKFGVGFSSDTQGENAFGLRVRHNRTWLNSLGAKWVNDLEVGTTVRFATELYQPLTLDQNFFAAAYANIASAPENLFRQGQKTGEFDLLGVRSGADFGLVLRDWGELRIGPQFAHYRAQPTIALPDAVLTRMDEWGLALLARVDTQDSAFFPRHGLRLTASAFAGTQRHGGARNDVTRLELEVQQAISVGERDTVQLGARLGRSSRFDPTFATNFHLGGFMALSGLRTGELQGTYVGLGRAEYLRRIGKLPVVGNPYYVGASLEIGNVWQDRGAISFGNTFKAGSVFVVADTLFGPLYLAWGRTSNGDSTWYLLLGRP